MSRKTNPGEQGVSFQPDATNLNLVNYNFPMDEETRAAMLADLKEKFPGSPGAAAESLSKEEAAFLFPELADKAALVNLIEQEIQMAEAGLTANEKKAVDALIKADDLTPAMVEKTRRSFGERKSKLLATILSLLVVFSMILAACAPASGTEMPSTGVPTVVASETIDAGPTGGIDPPDTDTAPAPATATAETNTNITVDQVAAFKNVVYQNGNYIIYQVDASTIGANETVPYRDATYGDPVFMQTPFEGQTGVLFVYLKKISNNTTGVAVGTRNGENVVVGLDANGNITGYVDIDGYHQGANGVELEAVNIDYFDLTPAERIEQSLALVEKANNFSGEIGVPVELNGQTYMFFWNPTAIDKYDTGLTGAWKPDGSSENLDRTGETLPPIVIQGYETEDGLVVVDPTTGQETFYANQNIPSLGGEISYRDLYSLPQSKLATVVTQDALKDTEFSSNSTVAENINALKDQAFYLPVILYGDQTPVFANGFDNGGGAGQDIPEGKYSAIETQTNNALVPIYSPETGDFMFFINIMSGNPLSVYTVFYSPEGNIDSRSVTRVNKLAFGNNNQDQFGIIGISNSRISHYLGGGSIFIENSPEVGEIDIIGAILKAQSEEEIFRILNEYRLLVAYPSIIYRPTN